jgi:hypothetical protein
MKNEDFIKALNSKIKTSEYPLYINTLSIIKTKDSYNLSVDLISDDLHFRDSLEFFLETLDGEFRYKLRYFTIPKIIKKLLCSVKKQEIILGLNLLVNEAQRKNTNYF